MILLSNTTHTLEVVTSSTSAIDYLICYADLTTTTFVPGDSQGAINTATTTTILAAPAASTQRQIKFISLVNKGASNNIITIQKDVSATNYEIVSAITLAADESLIYTDGRAFAVYASNGSLKTSVGLSDADYGDVTVTGTGTVMTIDPGVVTLAKMADIATAKVIGRTTAGTGVPEALSTTGTGNVVLSTSPTLVTPLLGTPTSGVLTNCTGLLVAGGGTGVSSLPGFYAQQSATQTITTSTFTKINCNTESLDTTGAYDNATNFRFTPLTAGTYLALGLVDYDVYADQATMLPAIFKNGALYSNAAGAGSGTGHQGMMVGTFVALNGSTDYIELFAYQASGSDKTSNTNCFFCAYRIGA